MLKPTEPTVALSVLALELPQSPDKLAAEHAGAVVIDELGRKALSAALARALIEGEQQRQYAEAEAKRKVEQEAAKRREENRKRLAADQERIERTRQFYAANPDADVLGRFASHAMSKRSATCDAGYVPPYASRQPSCGCTDASTRSAPFCRESMCLTARQGRPFLHGTVVKYGLQSGTLAERGRVFRERIEQGAFRDVIEELGGRVPVVLDHDMAEPVGRADIWETADGVEFLVELDGWRGREIIKKLGTGGLRGTSFSFAAPPHHIVYEGDVRTITHVARLDEVSILTSGSPAYTNPAPVAALQTA